MISGSVRKSRANETHRAIISRAKGAAAMIVSVCRPDSAVAPPTSSMTIATALRVDRGPAEDGEPHQAHHAGDRDHPGDELANRPPPADPGDEHAHKRCPGNPPRPVEDRPTGQPLVGRVSTRSCRTG